MATERCKNVIIGSGEGGKYLAWHMAQSGERMMVIERKWIGRTCPNINCLPAKNEVWSAKVADLVRHAQEFGTVTGPVSIDMESVRQRKREMVAALVAVHVNKYKSTGAELVMDQVRFTGAKTLGVRLNDGGERTITADRIFLNLGTHAAIPRGQGSARGSVYDAYEILELDCFPEHLIVIGGGYIGLEFAQAYRRFGSKVTIVQHSNQLLANEDLDVADESCSVFLRSKASTSSPLQRSSRWRGRDYRWPPFFVPAPSARQVALWKALLDPKDGRILGFTMVGAEAG